MLPSIIRGPHRMWLRSCMKYGNLPGSLIHPMRYLDVKKVTRALPPCPSCHLVSPRLSLPAWNAPFAPPATLSDGICVLGTRCLVRFEGLPVLSFRSELCGRGSTAHAESTRSLAGLRHIPALPRLDWRPPGRPPTRREACLLCNSREG